MHKKSLQSFERLLKIMDDLREKCPWDKKQTIESLKNLTIEEVYELADAISEKDMKGVKEELGDVLLHIIFYAKIAQEQKDFTLSEAIEAICDKLVFRHPHIYSDVVVSGEEEVKQNWEKLKLKEGKKSILEGVPKGLPSMVQAQRIQDKVRQVGFDWDETRQVVDRIREELNELSEAVQNNDPAEIENEMGDVLFAMINYARLLDLDAEKSLEMTNIKFIRRFQWMEEYAKSQNLSITDVTIKEMEKWWQMAKLEE